MVGLDKEGLLVVWFARLSLTSIHICLALDVPRLAIRPSPRIRLLIFAPGSAFPPSIRM